MPPKKKGKKGKKKASADDGDLTDPVALAKFFEIENKALRRKLANRTEDATRAIIKKRELQEKLVDLKSDFHEEKHSTFEITADMTRQYKAMQEELLTRINQLENSIMTLKQQLEDSRAKHEETKREKDATIARKDAEINELHNKMEDMANEFGDMLKETLEKMSERIEVSNTTWDDEGGSSVSMMNKLMDESSL
eukprot:TRINITY_DN781886_c0_g1_i1.p1 TRINITY_DN781886_c0_g1~~TRINITY_DN781886_c0_g1_i1.p1  ORF type:complete len:195 (+),score=64.87 TRINITY_DN781886_c0_g1_i1:305-889(+)